MYRHVCGHVCGHVYGHARVDERRRHHYDDSHHQSRDVLKVQHLSC